MSGSISATRRELLLYGAGAVGAVALTGLSLPGNAAEKKFNVALSNAYNGNEWRKQMAEACDRAAKEMQTRGLMGAGPRSMARTTRCRHSSPLSAT